MGEAVKLSSIGMLPGLTPVFLSRALKTYTIDSKGCYNVKMKCFPLAARLPFVTASALPVTPAIVWYALVTGKFNAVYAALCIVGVILVHSGANTINDYFDWNFSDAINPHAGP